MQTQFIKPQKKVKTLPELKKILDTHFNAFIRQRDQENGMFKCISCGEMKPTRLMHAGHYHSAGHNEATRWDEDNTNGQCVKCNTFLHGNLLGYQKGLLAKIGKQRLERLELRRHNKSKMFAFEVETLIKYYKKLKTKS